MSCMYATYSEFLSQQLVYREVIKTVLLHGLENNSNDTVCQSHGYHTTNLQLSLQF